MAALIVLVLIVAIVIGGLGLFLKAAFWLFWIGLILLIVGIIWALVSRAFSRGSRS